MQNLNRALEDIANIRGQMASNTIFQGFGPGVMALSGIFALLTISAQSFRVDIFAPTEQAMLWLWVGVAVLSFLLIAVETHARARRYHGGLADQMVQNALLQFLPVGFAGATIGAVILIFSPADLWLLPGLWQILVAVGLFLAARTLPPQIMFVAAWYFLAGTVVLIIGAKAGTVDPLMMGVPFLVGQWLLAGLLYFAKRED